MKNPLFLLFTLLTLNIFAQPGQNGPGNSGGGNNGNGRGWGNGGGNSNNVPIGDYNTYIVVLCIIGGIIYYTKCNKKKTIITTPTTL